MHLHRQCVHAVNDDDDDEADDECLSTSLLSFDRYDGDPKYCSIALSSISAVNSCVRQPSRAGTLIRF